VKQCGGTVNSAWRAFDLDGDGVITREEFCMAFDKAGMGTDVPMEHRLKLFAGADGSGCGQITYRDFAQSFAPYKDTPALKRIPSAGASHWKAHTS
jgi:Ca2+-binding EF-hand superfamily protein